MDREAHKTKCRSCCAPIFWTVNANGKRNPVDVEPTIDGSLFLFVRRDVLGRDYLFATHAAAASEVSEKAMARGQPRYISHFATCPDATKHRRRK